MCGLWRCGSEALPTDSRKRKRYGSHRISGRNDDAKSKSLEVILHSIRVESSESRDNDPETSSLVSGAPIRER